MHQLSTALNLHQSGDFESAENIYRQLLESYPDDAEVMHLLRVLLHQRGDAINALPLISQAVRSNTRSPVYHNNLAEVQRALGMLDEAVVSCLAALELVPDYAQASNNLGVCRFLQNQFCEAEQHFRAALSSQLENALTHSNLGDALREQGHVRAAINSYNKALALDPNLAAAHTNLGPTLLLIGKSERAITHCQRAVELVPNVAHHWMNLGQSL